jgi:S1-C subfamily serine protease
MTPIKTDKLPGKSAKFGFPRLVRPPLAVDVEFDRLDRGTFVIQLQSQIPSGTIGVNVAPDRGRGDLSSEVFLIPVTNGKRGEAVNLLTRRFEADTVAESGFQMPGGYDASAERFMLEFGLIGEEPVTIRRLEVEARIPATFGLSLGPDKGGVTVKSALKGGAGEKAGFKAGDTLVSMDSEKLTDLKSVMSLLSDAPIGRDIKFVIKRASLDRTIVVKGE